MPNWHWCGGALLAWLWLARLGTEQGRASYLEFSLWWWLIVCTHYGLLGAEKADQDKTDVLPPALSAASSCSNITPWRCSMTLYLAWWIPRIDGFYITHKNWTQKLQELFNNIQKRLSGTIICKDVIGNDNLLESCNLHLSTRVAKMTLCKIVGCIDILQFCIKNNPQR